MTITEALAQIKTIQKRIESKRETISRYVGRSEGLKDPLSKQGGSPAFIAKTLQAIGDLEQRVVVLRHQILLKNLSSPIIVQDITRNLQDWLTWRREIAPKRLAFVTAVLRLIDQTRGEVQRRGNKVFAAASAQINVDADQSDVIINFDEAELAKEKEHLETIVGELDGQLSLANATLTIDVAPIYEGMFGDHD